MVRKVSRVSVHAIDPLNQTSQAPMSAIVDTEDPNILITRGDAPTNPALFSKIDISGLTPIQACEKRNPGYLCFYKDRTLEQEKKTDIVAYRPVEICEKNNFAIYQDTQVLARQFQKKSPITLYLFMTLLFIGICTTLLYGITGYVFEGFIVGLLISFLFVFLHAVISTAKYRKDQLGLKITPMQLQSCFVNLPFYGKVLAIRKKDQQYNEVNPDTFVVNQYVSPTKEDRAIMYVNGKWNYREKANIVDAINLYKDMLANPKIEKL